MNVRILLSLLILPLVLLSQQAVAPTIQDKITYSPQNGYKISELLHMIYDDAGILWLVGNAEYSSDFQLLKRDYIIQRYDGMSFHDFKLPIQKEQTGTISFTKRKDGILFFKFHNKNVKILYRVDPISLEVREISSYEALNSSSKTTQIYPFKEELLLIFNKPHGAELYLLDSNEKFRYLSMISRDMESYPHFSKMYEFDDHFIINEFRAGLMAISYTGEQLDIRSPMHGKIQLKERFTYKGEVYLLLHSEGYYKYDPKSRSLEKAPDVLNIASNSIQDIIQDSLENIATIQKDLDQRIINRIIIDNNEVYEGEIILNKMHHIISRNISKELVVGTNAKLEHYFFNDTQIDTYLKDYSIRGIHQKSDTTFIVATALNGWFEVNTRAKTSSRIHFDDPVPLAQLTENRGIFKTEDGYFSNNRNGIVHLNTKTRKTTSYVYYPIQEMVDDDRYIYYGTLGFRLMKFDKELRKNISLAETDTLDFYGLKMKDSVLYGATNKGLLVYKNGKVQVYKPTKNSHENELICVTVCDTYGILAGSKLGKIYQYNPINQKFVVLYTDRLQASIATILKDDQNKLWINTFAGMVAFDPTNNSAVRYSDKDGMSHFECNRYSALKTDDGRFLVGTVRGLNIFRPEKMRKTGVVGEPTFTAISYFDNSTGQWKKETSPSQIKKMKKVFLPASQRRLVLEVGILGIINNHQIKYKYKLSQGGSKSIWNELTNQNQISLTNLAAGNYLLEVKAYTPILGNIGQILSLDIVSHPFFYETLWFKLIFILFVLIWIWYYIKHLMEKQHMQTQLTKNLIIGQQEERARLSREIHDGLGQQLILLLRKSQHDGHTEIQALASDMLDDVRSITKNLHPSILERLGISEALNQLINSVDERTSIFFTVHIDPIDQILSRDYELNLYRFVQECLNNIVKHSRAKSVSVDILKKSKEIEINIIDNGSGFDVRKKLGASYGIGLQTLFERIRILGGFLDIKSEIGRGTRITATIPLENDASRIKWLNIFPIFRKTL